MTDTSDIHLRPATRDDLATILEGCRDTLDRHLEHLPFAFYEGSFDTFYKPYIATCIDTQERVDEARIVHLAEVGGAFAGYVVIADSMNNGGGFEIFDIHVLPGFRKKGVGEALLDWCKSLAEEFDAHNLDATVWTLGDTREDFFAASGFTKVNARWRFGTTNPLPPEPVQRFTRFKAFLKNPDVLWVIIAALCLLVVAT
ncbi:MAG: GNAT family N-acetyltransferase [Pseudomonadota bacterium]